MRHIILCSFATVILTVLVQGQNQNAIVGDTVAMEPIEPFDTLDYAGRETKLFGDYYVGIDQIVRDPVRIFGGNLFVAGTVESQIIVLGGNVTLESTAIVNGRIVAIGGTIHKKEGAVVNGQVVEANIKEGITYSEGPGGDKETEDYNFAFEERTYQRMQRWIHPRIHWFIYNRNEGFRWTPINWHWDRRSRSTTRLSFSLGYRFGQEDLSGRLTLEQALFPRLFGHDNRNFIVFASAFRESRTDDGYRLPQKENTLASLFARQDFYDRWNEEGYELGAGLHLDWLRIKTVYRSAEIDSMAVTRRQLKTFQKDRQFRSNLPVVLDNVRSFLATVMTRTPGLEALKSGIGLLLMGEKILKADSLDNFTRLTALATANRRLAPDIVLRSRFLLGTAYGVLAEFRQFGVGALGSVSAYGYKVQHGNRMLQANMELIFLPDFLGSNWLIALFADAGHAWMEKQYAFTDLGTIADEALTAIGVGLGDDDLAWRVNVARPLDGRDVWETTFRLNLNF